MRWGGRITDNSRVRNSTCRIEQSIVESIKEIVGVLLWRIGIRGLTFFAMWSRNEFNTSFIRFEGCFLSSRTFSDFIRAQSQNSTSKTNVEFSSWFNLKDNINRLGG